jgi:nicotinamidase-related amidase
VDDADAAPECASPAAVERAAADLVVRKWRHSAFFGTELDLLLRERGVRRLILVGAQSHVCVRATAQDACSHGYDVLVVREAVGSDQTHLHTASLEDMNRYMGRVISMYEYVSLIASRR